MINPWCRRRNCHIRIPHRHDADAYEPTPVLLQILSQAPRRLIVRDYGIQSRSDMTAIDSLSHADVIRPDYLTIEIRTKQSLILTDMMSRKRWAFDSSRRFLKARGQSLADYSTFEKYGLKFRIGFATGDVEEMMNSEQQARDNGGGQDIQSESSNSPESSNVPPESSGGPGDNYTSSQEGGSSTTGSSTTGSSTGPSAQSINLDETLAQRIQDAPRMPSDPPRMPEEEENRLANADPHSIASSQTMGGMEAQPRHRTGTGIADALTGITQATGSTQSVATAGTMDVATEMGIATGPITGPLHSARASSATNGLTNGMSHISLCQRRTGRSMSLSLAPRTPPGLFRRRGDSVGSGPRQDPGPRDSGSLL